MRSPCTSAPASSAPIRTPTILRPVLFSCGWRWRLEALVDFHLIAAGQAVALVGHPHYGHEFSEHGLAHTRLARARGMGGDAVAALLEGAHGQVDHLLGKGIKHARRHDLLDTLPGAA